MARADERLRVLRGPDAATIGCALDVDPVTDVFLDARLRDKLDGRRLDDEVVGYREGDGSMSLCWTGVNIVPTANTSPEAALAYAGYVRRRGVYYSSLWGPQEPVARMWQVLRRHARPPRSVRPDQLFMLLDREPDVAPDPHTQRVDMAEFDAFYDASVRFFIEELGSSPEAVGGGGFYRARVANLIRHGRAFARFEDGRLVAKAELALATRHASQIQGVWVRPDHRRQGLAAPMLATVCQAARAEVAPVVTLYVNDFNLPARKAYTRLGFRHTADFMTVLW
jgi:predicted GNAT family acetyltransferase